MFAHIGDRTECALLQFVLDSGVYYPYIRDRHPESDHVKVFRFNPQRKSMTTVIKDEDGYYKIYSKGAADVLLSRCKNVLLESGVEPLTNENVCTIKNTIKKMQDGSGLKVMCVAYKLVKGKSLFGLGLLFVNRQLTSNSFLLQAI